MASGAMFMVKEAVESLVSAVPSHDMLLVFADLGSSTGANTLATFSEVLHVISRTCDKLGRPAPELQLLLNDLPANDFNTLLDSVLSAYKQRIKESMRDSYIPFYTAAVPGSFYDRLFPKRSVHFIYSCASLHWLSQARIPMYLRKKKQYYLLFAKLRSKASKIYFKQLAVIYIIQRFYLF
jgi:salicylate 1-O-methyltransferase